MQFRLAIQGKLADHMAAEVAALQTASEKAVTGTATEIKTAAATQVARRFTRNRRAASAIRTRVYKDGPGDVAALVWSRFGRRGPGGEFVDYLEPIARGLTIRPRASQWIYIPLQRGRRAKNMRRSVSATANLAFVPIGSGRALLVRRTRTRSTLIALLVRRVSFRRGFNFDRIVDQARNAMPGRLVEEINRNA